MLKQSIKPRDQIEEYRRRVGWVAPSGNRLWAHIKNFKEKEFVCKCGCGRIEIDFRIVSWLERLRGELDTPIIINSAYRCGEHEEEKARTADGRFGEHRLGYAVDVALGSGPSNSWQLLEKVFTMQGAISPTRLGVKQKGDRASRFFHIGFADNTYFTAPAIWSY